MYRESLLVLYPRNVVITKELAGSLLRASVASTSEPVTTLTVSRPHITEITALGSKSPVNESLTENETEGARLMSELELLWNWANDKS